MDHFVYRDGMLCAEEVAIAAIAAEVGTPFYCYSSATLTRHFRVFHEALEGYDRKICFAVKSNSNIAVLRTLAQAGAGADVVSGGEIRLALAAGIAPQNIVFSGVAKTKEEIAFALQQGIFQFNAESVFELRALNDVATSMGVIAPVALRVNPDVDPATHEKISTGQKENKFGIAMEQVHEAYALAASLPALKVQGVSMHIGSQLTSLTPFRQAFRAVLALVAELRAAGHPIHTLDLGGGLGIPYSSEMAPPEPLEYAQAVKEEVGEFDGQLIFEPGRMIAGNAGILVSKVIGLKESPHKRFVMLDAGMNDLMRPALYDAYHEIIAVNSHQSSPVTSHYDIVGPVCESSDIFGKDRALPVLAEGDLVAFRSCGAYGASMSNSYNARPLVPEVLVSGTQWAVVRRRPSYEEMMALQQFPEW
jgi:diaminopimelate decarboxylase